MSSGWSSPALEAIGRLLRARTGLVFRTTRIVDAELGIQRVMARKRVTDGWAYLDRLESNTTELEELVNELTVGETYFFRDPVHFDFIRNDVIPTLLRVSRERMVRVWSAGCSSGEEAYSLAILLDEYGLSERAQVLATDISRTALAKAREASYGAWSFRGVNPLIVDRYFRSVGPKRILSAKIRARVQLERLNLASDPYPSLTTRTTDVDLILCRNVLIYLDEQVVRDVCRRLVTCLSPTGWLILGPSDPHPQGDDVCEPVHIHGAVFFRRRTTGKAALVSLPPLPALEARPNIAPIVAPAPPRVFEPFEAPSVAKTVEDESSAAAHVRAIANTSGAEEAHRVALEAARRYPSSSELQLIDGALLLELELYEEARNAARRALYLDRSLAFAHFLHGLASIRLGDGGAARKSLVAAHQLCARQAPDAVVAHADGVTARSFLETIATQLELLGASDASVAS